MALESRCRDFHVLVLGSSRAHNWIATLPKSVFRHAPQGAHPSLHPLFTFLVSTAGVADSDVENGDVAWRFTVISGSKPKRSSSRGIDWITSRRNTLQQVSISGRLRSVKPIGPQGQYFVTDRVPKVEHPGVAVTCLASHPCRIEDLNGTEWLGFLCQG